MSPVWRCRRCRGVAKYPNLRCSECDRQEGRDYVERTDRTTTEKKKDPAHA